jgi:hypothetical protein
MQAECWVLEPLLTKMPSITNIGQPLCGIMSCQRALYIGKERYTGSLTNLLDFISFEGQCGYPPMPCYYGLDDRRDSESSTETNHGQGERSKRGNLSALYITHGNAIVSKLQ